jgi:hypothetical protein
MLKLKSGVDILSEVGGVKSIEDARKIFSWSSVMTDGRVAKRQRGNRGTAPTRFEAIRSRKCSHRRKLRRATAAVLAVAIRPSRPYRAMNICR